VALRQSGGTLAGVLSQRQTTIRFPARLGGLLCVGSLNGKGHASNFVGEMFKDCKNENNKQKIIMGTVERN
jgi:hypothetical protein